MIPYPPPPTGNLVADYRALYRWAFDLVEQLNAKEAEK